MAEKRYAVLIGSSKYSDKSGLQDLRCPENDVVGLREILAAKQLGGFDDTIVCVNEPHYAVLLRLGEVFERAGSDDLVLIYFSGHGKLDLVGNLYLATTNTLSKSLSVTSIPVEQLRQLISTSRTKKIVLILDCCYSGAADKAFLKGEAGNELSRVAQVKAKGTYILTASTQIQAAIEKEGDKYGLLTKHIIEGIRDGGAARDDGLVSMDSLYGYVSNQVGEEGPQQPMHWALGAVGDEMVIAAGGSPTGAARRIRIHKVMPALKRAIDDDVLRKTVQLVNTPVESLSLEQQPFDRLLDLLLENPPDVKNFVKRWRLEERLQQTEEQQRKVAQLYSTAQEAFGRKDLQTTIDSLKNLLEIDSEHGEAIKLLCQAREQKTLADLYDKGKAAYDSRSWEEAVKVFDQIVELDKSYRDVADLRQKAATTAAEEMVAHSMAAARQSLESDNFASAREELVKLLAAIPNCNEARELLNEIDRGQKLSSLYKQGQDSIEAEQWAQALDQFNEVRSLDPDYKEVAYFIEFVTEVIEKEEVERLLRDAHQAIERGEFSIAKEKLLQIIALHPKSDAAKHELESVNRQLEIINLYDTGVKLYNVRRFEEARQLLKDLESKQPDYKKTREVLKAIDRETHPPPPPDHHLYKIAAIVSGAVLVIVLISVVLHISGPTGSKTIVNTNSRGNLPADPPPDPYRDVVKSLAVVTRTDSSGRQNRGMGFFVTEDQLLTTKSLIDDAAHIGLSVQGTQYEIESVSGIDPVHHLALLKIKGAKVSPLALGSEINVAGGEKANFIRTVNTDQPTSTETATVSSGGADLLSLSGSIAAEDKGGPLLNQQGNVTGIIVETSSGQTADAARATHIKTLMDSKQPMMPLVFAAASNRVFDFKTDYDRNKLPNRSSTEYDVPEPLRQKIIEAAFPDVDSRNFAKIASRAQGPFSGPEVIETAYLVDSHAGTDADKRIVIMAGDPRSADVSPARILDAHPFFAIRNSTDFNRDGVKELLLLKHQSVMGRVVVTLSLAIVGEEGVKVLQEFDALVDQCDMSSPGNKEVVATILYSSASASGEWPQFRLDRYVSKCTDLHNGFIYVSSSPVSIKAIPRDRIRRRPAA